MLAVCALLLWLNPATLSSVEQTLGRGDYARALDQLNSVENRDARWHLLASRAWDGLNDPGKAVEEAEAALNLDPGDPAYQVQLAEIFLSRNTPQAALDILSDAQTLFPESFVVRLGKGLAEKELQRYDDAEKSLQW